MKLFNFINRNLRQTLITLAAVLIVALVFVGYYVLADVPTHTQVGDDIFVIGSVGIGTTEPTNIISLGNAAARKFWIENSATDVVGRDLTVAAGGTLAGTAVDDVIGGNLILQSGLGTGTGASTISFQTGTTLTTGKTLQTMSTKMTILGNGYVGIGTDSPGHKLHVVSTPGTIALFQAFGDSGNNDFTIQGERFIGFNLDTFRDSVSGTPEFRMRRARGTIAIPAAVQSGDETGSFFARGYDGANYKNSAGIMFSVDGAVATNSVPGRVGFWTTPVGGTTFVERLTITNAGNVGIGTTKPGADLHLRGDELRVENPDGTASVRLYSNPVGEDDVGRKWMFFASGYDGGFGIYDIDALARRMTIAVNGNVGIGTESPNANAILDVVSTTKAFMPPRMTTTQRDAIASPTAGMVIYNSTTNVLNFYNGSAWGAI